MSSNSHYIKPRSRSVPLPSGRSRLRNLTRAIAALHKVKIQPKQGQGNDQRLPSFTRQKLQDDSTRPQFLMPRVEIIDDMNKERLVVKLEIPDVDPSKVKLRLHGNLLSVFGERTPDLSAVAEEYRDGLRFHSQSDMGSYHRPKVILLGGGRVASLSTQINVPSNLTQSSQNQSSQNQSSQNQSSQNQSSQNPASPPPSPGHVRAERVHYNEMRYGAFCRNLRIPVGTKASDIEGQFVNGMLILSWPKAHTSTVSGAIEEEESDINIPIPSSAPVTVKVESADMEIDSSL